jgi:Recombinase zinc beta ribbon domain/Resolvase, N terminal domain/Recombinase
MPTTKTNRPLAAVGIRISELGKRGKQDGPRLHSDVTQEDKARELCESFGLDVAYTFEELDTSGTLPLAGRPKLLDAVERMERGDIQAIVFPYRDRFDRSIPTMTDVVVRVDNANGLLIAGGSVVTHKTADAWARATLESFANEMPARYAKEKVHAAHIRAVGQGITCTRPVPGYAKADDGTLVVVRELMPVIRGAFERRDRGESLGTIRSFLAAHDIRRSFDGIDYMLKSKTYLGLVTFGELAYRGEGIAADDNTHEPVPFHEPIIDADLWHRVQGRRGTRGRQGISDRLLARQQVLVCGGCGARMSSSSGGGYNYYRCQHSSSPDCPARASIMAERVEDLVVARLHEQRELTRLEGVASADLGEQLHQAARDAQADLEAALEAFAGVEGLGAAKRRIAELTERWQDADRAAAQHQRNAGAQSTIRHMDDWDRLTLDGRRGIIRATIDRVVIAPAYGRTLSKSKFNAGRVDVQFVGEG